jgi:hypothetical protein
MMLPEVKFRLEREATKTHIHTRVHQRTSPMRTCNIFCLIINHILPRKYESKKETCKIGFLAIWHEHCY